MSEWKIVSKRKAKLYQPGLSDLIDKGFVSVQVKKIFLFPAYEPSRKRKR